MNALYLIGTSGWSYQHWRGRFYPSELPRWEWFRFYVREFATVELNVSFYRLPPRKRFEEWAALAQDREGFRFAVKAPRVITHQQRLVNVHGEMEKFLTAVSGLGNTLGPLLFQLPPSFPIDVDRLRSFLALLPPSQFFALEFRHPSWFCEPVYEVVEEARGTVVFAYGGFHPTPATLPAIGPFVYLRVHSGLSDIGLSEEEIEHIADLLAQWADRPGYVYFNNDAFAHAIVDARRLREALARRSVAVA